MAVVVSSAFWKSLILPFSLDIFETPVTVTPKKKFQKLEILQKFP